MALAYRDKHDTKDKKKKWRDQHKGASGRDRCTRGLVQPALDAHGLPVALPDASSLAPAIDPNRLHHYEWTDK